MLGAAGAAELRASFVPGDASALPFGNGEFDAAVITLVSPSIIRGNGPQLTADDNMIAVQTALRCLPLPGHAAGRPVTSG